MKKYFMIAAGALAALYLINPGFGIFEFVPDAFPVVGHLDEATAIAVLLSTLTYFGIDSDQKNKK